MHCPQINPGLIYMYNRCTYVYYQSNIPSECTYLYCLRILYWTCSSCKWFTLCSLDQPCRILILYSLLCVEIIYLYTLIFIASRAWPDSRVTTIYSLAHHEGSSLMAAWSNPYAAVGLFGKYKMIQKRKKKWLKTWLMYAHLRVLSDSFLMNSNTTRV